MISRLLDNDFVLLLLYNTTRLPLLSTTTLSIETRPAFFNVLIAKPDLREFLLSKVMYLNIDIFTIIYYIWIKS